MANQKLQIDIIAKDLTKRTFGGLQGALGRLKKSVFSLQSAFVGLGAGLVARNLVQTGKDIENLRVRLKFLLKNTQEGTKAFDNMAKFASRVPFSLEEISQGSGILATVTDNADDLQKMLEITGNVAATTGLDFRTAAEQIQRSFSAGIGAADLFREKGVRNMLGFQAGATVSIEDTVAAFERVFGRGGRFGKSTDELAKTFQGTLSMIGDKIFTFKKVLLEAGFFEELKNQFGELDKFLANNAKEIDRIATALGKNLAKALVGVVDIGKKLVPFFKEVFDFLKGIKDTFFALPEVIQQIGVIGAVLLGKKGFVGLAVILAAIKKAEDFGKKFGDKGVSVKLLPFEHELSGNEQIAERNRLIYETAQAIEKVKLKEAEAYEEFLKTQQPIHDIAHDMSIVIPSATEKTLNKFKELNAQPMKAIEDKMKNIKHILIEEVVGKGITSMSQGIARAVVFGEKLSDTFRNMAQNFLANIISKLIEVIARKGVELAIERMITNEKKKQAALSGVSAGGSFFSAIGSIFKANGGAVQKGQPYIVGERGAEMFIPNQSGQIQQAARGTNGGQTTVNFNINTLDASGFDELLVRNRGTITSIINSAVNERGSKNLI
nr:tape measure protein [uncultured Mediterranean phage uvMED]